MIEFGDFVTGEDLIAERLTTTAEALRWLSSSILLKKGTISWEGVAQ